MRIVSTGSALLAVAVLFCGDGPRATAVTPGDVQAPVLNWEPRSDWLSVKTCGAVGDGVADDAAAIQAVYDRIGKPNQPHVVYFPPGTYRITKTLTIVGDVAGIAIIGHGRDTVLAWDGEKGGSMYWSNGVHRSRYEGLTYDGRGKAGIGSEHRSMARYETHLIYQHCSFLNLDNGIAVSKNERKQASAEIWYHNCLFRNTGTGVLFNQFNDYDNWLDGCVFIDNGVAVDSQHGHFHVRNSHFFGSRVVDARQGGACHPSSLRWCTSTGSRRFFETGGGRHTYPFTLQDNWVEGWTAEDGAVRFGLRGPNLVFDNTFVKPPNTKPPIRLVNGASKNPWSEQLVVASNNRGDGGETVIDPGAFSRLSDIPPGKCERTLRTGREWFFQGTVNVTGKVFDAKRDFGARGDGSADDTAAVQRTIDAAREHGKGAVAYLPYGTYKISSTLTVTGADYTVGSTGCGSKLNWQGPQNAVMMAVRNPHGVTIEHLELNGPDSVTRIRQTGDDGRASVYYNNLHLPSVYSNTPGIELVELPPGATVRTGLIGGYLHVVDSGQATILSTVHLGRTVIEGARLPKTGFTGMLFHNDAGRDCALTVKDNQDLVVGDFYNESNERFLRCEGGSRSGAGRVTIGASKVCVLKPQELLTVDNYEGRIFVGTASIIDQNGKNLPLTITHTGTRPLDFILAASVFCHTDPVYNVGPGWRFTGIGDNLWALKDAKSYPDTIAEGGLLRAAEALDDFRQLGAVNRALNYPAAP
jgi:hypothetical protein